MNKSGYALHAETPIAATTGSVKPLTCCSKRPAECIRATHRWAEVCALRCGPWGWRFNARTRRSIRGAHRRGAAHGHRCRPVRRTIHTTLRLSLGTGLGSSRAACSASASRRPATTSPHGCPVRLRDGVEAVSVALAASGVQAAMISFVAPRAPRCSRGHGRAIRSPGETRGSAPVPTHIPDWHPATITQREARARPLSDIK